jgi:hypothetical protein
MLSTWRPLTSTPKWTVECLRDANCTKPTDPETDCHKFLQCSNCSASEFACQLTHECVEASSICNGKVECGDATDEIGCENLEWWVFWLGFDPGFSHGVTWDQLLVHVFVFLNELGEFGLKFDPDFSHGITRDHFSSCSCIFFTELEVFCTENRFGFCH